MRSPKSKTLLGGSWVAISGVRSPRILVVSTVTVPITLLTTTLNLKPYTEPFKGTLNPFITSLTTTHEPPKGLQTYSLGDSQTPESSHIP